LEIVIDTSAVIAVMSEQPEKAEMIQLTRGATLVAPSSLHWEIGNALSAMFKRRAIAFANAIRATKAYRAIPIRFLDIDLEQALELSHQMNIYAYDAYILACAVNQRASILTLDRALRERARELKLAVLEVGKP
jgi:predicted nucleic acid-binding protein